MNMFDPIGSFRVPQVYKQTYVSRDKWGFRTPETPSRIFCRPISAARKMLEIDPKRVDFRVFGVFGNALLKSLSGDFVAFQQKSPDIVPDRTNDITFRHTSDP